MSAFGITATTASGRTYYWIGEDNRLFDWLRANDYEPSDLGAEGRLLIVRAPDGYAFHHRSSLVVVDSDELREIYGSSIGDKGYVMASYPLADKLEMVFQRIRQVAYEEFLAANFAANRILKVEFPQRLSDEKENEA